MRSGRAVDDPDLAKWLERLITNAKVAATQWNLVADEAVLNKVLLKKSP
jgi:hypothetical protein